MTGEEKGRGSLAEKRMAMVVTGGGMMHSLLDCGSFPTPSPQYHVSLVAVSSSLPAYSSSSRFGGGSKPLLLRCQAPGAYKLDCSTRLNPIVVSASSTQSSRYEGDSREEGLKNSTMASTPFHLAIPVHDIKAAREFFGGVLGCPEGRSAKTWVDFNLFGHQVVCHEVRNYNAATTANAVDGDPVPVPHFGLAMSVDDFGALAERVQAAGVKFIIEPHIRFKGQPGEQWTMFFKDTSGNALEFKAMTNPQNLFAKYHVE